MNWAAFAGIVSLCTLLATIAVGLITYGKLTQRVDDNSKRTDKHEERLDEHDSLIGEHAVALRGFDAWNKGYEAAAKSNAGASR